MLEQTFDLHLSPSSLSDAVDAGLEKAAPRPKQAIARDRSIVLLPLDAPVGAVARYCA
jgi:hypothetical protein